MLAVLKYVKVHTKAGESSTFDETRSANSRLMIREREIRVRSNSNVSSIVTGRYQRINRAKWANSPLLEAVPIRRNSELSIN